MLRNDGRRPRRNGGTQRRRTLAWVESLEGRQLLATSALGFSQPDLTVSGFAAPVAAWNGPLAVSVDVRNIAAATYVDPLNLPPGSPTTADGGPATVQVFITNGNPHTFRGVEIGSFTVPSIPSNSSIRLNETLTMPSQLPHFPIFGGRVYVQFVVSQDPNTTPEANPANNSSVAPRPVVIEPALPDLYAVGLIAPPVMQPGDTIEPNIEIANFGTVDSATQGPFQVLLVATTKRNSLFGASVLASFTVQSLTPLSEVASTNAVLGDVDNDVAPNIDVLNAPPITLPLTPSKYFLTVVVDPGNQVFQLKNFSRSIRRNLLPDQAITPIVQVGPPQRFLPPASGLNQPASSQASNPFPDPAFPVNPVP